MEMMRKGTYGYKDWYLEENIDPESFINRGEAAMGIDEIHNTYAHSYIGREDEIYEYLSNTYTDVEDIGGFRTTVWSITKKGFMDGYEDGTFRVGNHVTRAELCAILYRAFIDNTEMQDSASTLTYKPITSDYYTEYNIKTYSSITGIELSSTDILDNGDTVYIYPYTNAEDIGKYWEYLDSEGCILVKENDESTPDVYETAFATKDFKKGIICYTYLKWDEIWITLFDVS